MASLRNLLGQEFQSTLGGVEGQVPEPLHQGRVLTFNYQKQCCCYSCGLDQGSRTMWCVPVGTTRATFEAWGGGGGQASTCCCSVSTPGSTGAYARRTISVTPGECYILCVGCSNGGLEYGDKRGCRGRFSAICSYGDNGTRLMICAEGGYGGCAICDFMIAAGVTPSTDRQGGTGNFFGVNKPVFYPNEANNCVDCGPRAYGGDVNICGRPGYMRYHCVNNCAVQFHIPYPPALINANGGWVVAHHCTNNNCADHNYASSFIAMSGAYSRFQDNVRDDNDRNEYTVTPGSGKMGSISSGSTCRYGTTSPGGMVRITYWNDVCGLCGYGSQHFCG